MRVLIVGGGSIGKRHLRNLKAMGFNDVAVCGRRPEPLVQLQKEFDVAVGTDLVEALGRSPDLTLVTTPTSMHIPIARAAAEAGSHLFIEKPISNTLDGIDGLIDVVRKKHLVALVACCVRYHHGPATIKRLLEENAIGQVTTALVDMGQYLPDWRPGRDYRKGYGASKEMGGGIILDGIHEIDYVRWLFGEVAEVFCIGGKLSRLEIETEDCVNVLMKMEAGFGVHLHMDYIQRCYSRTIKVIGEEGTIVWDISRGSVDVFSAEAKEWKRIKQPDNYEWNEMYVDEIRHLIRCVEGKEEPSLGIEGGRRVLEIAEAIRLSIEKGDKVTI